MTRRKLCRRCGSEGRLYSGHPNDPHPVDAGECPDCGGTGFESRDVAEHRRAASLTNPAAIRSVGRARGRAPMLDEEF
jgi:hypothetical protein